MMGSHQRLFLAPLLFTALLATTSSMARSDPRQMYWFENYERAVQWIDEGNLKAASGVLAQLIQEHPLPVAGMKIPGNRFIDYFPYFQRARIQVAKRDAEGASSSLEICEAYGAISQSVAMREKLRILRLQIEALRQDAQLAASRQGAS